MKFPKKNDQLTKSLQSVLGDVDEIEEIKEEDMKGSEEGSDNSEFDDDDDNDEDEENSDDDGENTEGEDDDIETTIKVEEVEDGEDEGEGSDSDEEDDGEDTEEDSVETNSDFDDDENEDEEGEEPEEITDDDLEEPEEITDEEFERMNKEEDDKEITGSEDDGDDDDENDDGEEPEEITDDDISTQMGEEGDDSEDENDENDDGEEPEEITDEEVETAKASMTKDSQESSNDIATASVVSLLTSIGYGCSVNDADGSIKITAGDDLPVTQLVTDFKDEEVTSPENVDLVLHDSVEKDPYYTVILNGKPAASIHLEDQEKPEEKKDYFIGSEYPKALVDAMVKGGCNSVLDAQRARRFVAAVSSSKVAAAMKEEAKREMQEQVEGSIIAAKDRFIECVNVAIAGMNKNFFSEDNNLKAACYAAFTSLGMNEDEATAKTNSVFEQSPSFFKTVVAKAQELMTYEEQAFKTVAAAIGDSGTINRNPETLSTRLAKGNSPIVASLAGFSGTKEKVVAGSGEKPNKKLVFRRNYNG